MKNVSTKKFYSNCTRGFLVKKYQQFDFIHEFKTMKECYDSLLAGHPNIETARERLAMILARKGVIPSEKLIGLRVECVRRIQQFIKNEKSSECFRVCCNYSRGFVTDLQLNRIRESVVGIWKNNHSSIDAANGAAQCGYLCFDLVIECMGYQGEEQKQKEIEFQFELFKKFGNPFTE